MENVSKTLIIAGAILVAIILISGGLLILNSKKGIEDRASDTGNI